MFACLRILPFVFLLYCCLLVSSVYSVLVELYFDGGVANCFYIRVCLVVFVVVLNKLEEGGKKCVAVAELLCLVVGSGLVL